MADEEEKLDIEEEVPAIEDEIKKPEKDEGKVDAAEREWNYQREPDAQDLEAPDMFSNFRKETLPIFNTKDVNIDTPFGTASQDEKQQKKPTKPKMTKPRPTATGSLNTGKRPQHGTFEAHLVKNPDTTRYNFMRSMLEFHDKIATDADAEQTPIGAQPTGRTGSRGAGAPFKMGKGKKVGQLQSLVGGSKKPFGSKGKKGVVGRGAKQRQGGTSSPSPNAGGAMAGLGNQYQPKMQVKPNPAGLGSPFKQQVGHQKVPKRAPAKPVKDRAQGEAQAIKQPTHAGSSGQITPPKEENRKLPRPKKLNRKGEKKEVKRIQQQRRESAGRGSKKNPPPASGEKYRKQQAAEALARKLGRKMPSSGSGAPKIAAMLKAWYGEIYGI